MIRDQCKTFCQCSYCEEQRTRKRDIPDKTVLPPCTGRTKDELYLATLNSTLQAKSLMASSRNAHKFKPDEVLESTRGDMVRAALTVPVRRRDRLQELLILENKQRLKSQRELRESRRAAGLPYENGDGNELLDRAVGTSDDFPEATQVNQASDVKNMPASGGSAEEELLSALHVIKKITDEHDAKDYKKPLTSEHIYQLKRLVHEQDAKTKQLVANSQQQPHTCNHGSTANTHGRHVCYFPPTDATKEASLPSVNKGLTGRFKYNPHPYGTGVVWLPLESDEEALDETENKHGSLTADEKYDNKYQYPGSTHNNYQKFSKAQTSDLSVNANANGNADVGSANANVNGSTANTAAKDTSNTTATHKNPHSYKSSAALWRTTNQDQAAQMQYFLDFKKMHLDASRVYAEGATKRPADNTLGAKYTAAATARN